MARRPARVASAELRLENLAAAPDPGAAHRMEAFDRLPRSIRRLLVNGPFDFNAIEVVRAVESDGASAAAWKVQRSNEANARRFARERQLALEWARDAFRIGPRPKGEAPPGGWTVHDFPG